jgi:hypothetical protein
MSFNRLTYDNCAYSTTVKESVSSLDYNLFKGKFENCGQCKTGDFTNVLAHEVRADVESELLGLPRPNSKCPTNQYDPSKPYNKPDFSPPTMCQSIYYITPSNLTKPTSNLLNEANLTTNFCPK